VLSREALIELTRAAGVDVNDRSIDLAVSRLRAKLGDSPREPHLIKTLRGEGYLFDARCRCHELTGHPWRADTLGVRLFLLMWAALVLSHAVAFFTVHALRMPGADTADRPPFIERDGPPLPTFPSLPPTRARRVRRPRARGPPPDGRTGRAVRRRAAVASVAHRLRRAPRGDRRSGVVGLALAGPAGEPAGRGLVSVEHCACPRPAANPARRDARHARGAGCRIVSTDGGQIKHHFDARGLMIAAISHDLRTPLTRCGCVSKRRMSKRPCASAASTTSAR
jgi:hypothetical protein